MASRLRQPFLIVTAFWAYVAASNVIYAHSMQESLATLHAEDFFAGWEPRLLQHLFLYPLLLGGVWGSLRIGWQPIGRRLPLQVLMGGAFAVAASPALWLGMWLLSNSHRVYHMHETWASAAGVMGEMPGSSLPIWLASATTFLLTYGFAVALVSGFDFYRRLRDSQIRAAALERALTTAHLASLRMQLSPHSLFNLLHTIRGQIDWDPAAARTMIVQLGDLLRRLLNAGEREYSRLADEVQFVRLYLELQQRRFADRLSVDIPEPAALPSAWVPSLILQPLVENAVVHGLSGHQGPVVVRVSAVSARGSLVLRVANTFVARPAAGSGGIGLRNVRDRLTIQFGERASFRAGPEEGEWVAEIRMPLLTDVLVATPAAAEAASPPVSAEPLGRST
ncbi:MAG TPA: histidine kinase [Steroidobacteraceae bacterium]|nr:histidine kinase [Steroidobacteraceae bacterium]